MNQYIITFDCILSFFLIISSAPTPNAMIFEPTENVKYEEKNSKYGYNVIMNWFDYPMRTRAIN